MSYPRVHITFHHLPLLAVYFSVGFPDDATRPAGIPTLRHYLDTYGSFFDMPMDVHSTLEFYIVFTMFRGVSIATGIYNRFKKGSL